MPKKHLVKKTCDDVNKDHAKDKLKPKYPTDKIGFDSLETYKKKELQSKCFMSYDKTTKKKVLKPPTVFSEYDNLTTDEQLLVLENCILSSPPTTVFDPSMKDEVNDTKGQGKDIATDINSFAMYYGVISCQRYILLF